MASATHHLPYRSVLGCQDISVFEQGDLQGLPSEAIQVVKDLYALALVEIEFGMLDAL